MSFDSHAFISYAHIDNEPLTPGEKGWVTQFHATLQTMLSQRLGERASIWRDDKLAGNDIFDQEIVAQFAKTAVIVSILSPRYLRSEWCTRELREFCEAAGRTGGLALGNKSRVFKVVKTPIESGASLPPIVERMLGYEFYAMENDEPTELDPAFGEALRQQFLSKLSRLAWDMAKSLQSLSETAGREAASTARPVVFLAECGRDLTVTREQIETDLRMHGYDVLPAQQLPMNEDALAEALEALLERAALSIHLVGKSAGSIPDGPSGRSVAMLVNQLAAERCRHSGLKRIIWLPDGVTGERAEQQSFIDALQRDAALQYGADLLRGDVEALKGAVHLTLRRIETPAPTPPPASADKPVVHVLMSEADRAGAVPLLRLLRAQGLDATVPVFAGDATAMRQANAQLASGCDALILYYGDGDEIWKFHHLNELRKQQATRTRPRSDWLCLAPPSTPDKEFLKSLAEPNLIDALGGVSDAALAPVVAGLRAER